MALANLIGDNLSNLLFINLKKKLFYIILINIF